MAGLNVPASRNGLPLRVASGVKPVYTGNAPTSPRTLPARASGIAKLIQEQVHGTVVPRPAYLPVNFEIGKGTAPVRAMGPIAGIGQIKKLGFKALAGTPAGPTPGTGTGPSGGGGGGGGGGSTGGTAGGGTKGGGAGIGVEPLLQI